MGDNDYRERQGSDHSNDFKSSKAKWKFVCVLIVLQTRLLYTCAAKIYSGEFSNSNVESERKRRIRGNWIENTLENLWKFANEVYNLHCRID